MDQKQINENYERAQKLFYAGEYAQAFAEYVKLASEGHSSSMAMMGYLYEVGRGVERDYYKAVEWYKKSAELGDAIAQYNLASCYKGGRGVEKDLVEAVRWFAASAEQGNLNAQYTLAFRHLNGEGTPQSNDEYIKWITKSAFGGNLNAQYALGCDYFDGTNGVEKSAEKAEILLKRPAQGGNARAQLLLGRIYKKGGAVPKDEKKAFELFELSSAKEPEALYELGLCYYNSVGVKKNHSLAMSLIEQSAEAGVEKARVFVDRVEEAERQRAWINEGFKSFVKATVLLEDTPIEHLERACEYCEYYISRGGEGAKLPKSKLHLLRYCLAIAYYKRDLGSSKPNLYGANVSDDAMKALENMERSAELGYAQAQFILWALYTRRYGLAQADIDANDYDEEAMRMLKRSAEQGHKEAIEVLKKIQ